MLFGFMHIFLKNYKKNMKFFQYRTFLECVLFQISDIMALFFFIDLVLEPGFHRYFVTFFCRFRPTFLIVIDSKVP